MHTPVRTAAFAAVAAAGLVLAACSSPDDEPTNGEPDQSEVDSSDTEDSEETEDTEDSEETEDGGAEDGDADADAAGDDDAAGNDGAAGNDDESEGDDAATDDGVAEVHDLDGDFNADIEETPDYPTAQDSGSEPTYPIEARIGEHDGFDRVTIEYVGDAVPGWRAEYSEEPPTAMGSGETSTIDGEMFLIISATGLAMGQDGVLGELHGATEPAGVIRGVSVNGVVEGHGGIGIGLDDELPYRINALEDPTRLVNDIATESSQ